MGAVVVAKFKTPSSIPAADLYTRHATLFSPAERSFFGVLEQALRGDCRIFGKVRLSDIAEPKRGLAANIRRSALNRIQLKHLDFELCDPDTLEIRVAIELDDSTHTRRSRRERDTSVESVCENIALPLLRIPAQHSYSLVELRKLLQSHITTTPNHSVVTQAESGVAESPPCPKCGATMVLRTAKGGDAKGNVFWGCGSFPKCRAIIDRLA